MTDQTKNPPEAPAGSITITPIPYYPSLRKQLVNQSCALIVAYLESRFPAPHDPKAKLASLPVDIPMNQVSHELAISRRTLGMSIQALSKVFALEGERVRAQRAGREFIEPRHTKSGKLKLYSVVTHDQSLQYVPFVTIRRNLPLLAQIQANSGVSLTPEAIERDAEQAHQRLLQGIAHSNTPRQTSCDPRPGPPVVERSSHLSDLLLKASVLAGDRRSTRYERQRRADAEVVERRKAKRKCIIPVVTDAVNPELPEEVTARFIHLQKRS